MNKKKSALLLSSVLLLLSLLTQDTWHITTFRQSNLLAAIETPPPPQTRNINLYVRANYLLMPDGQKIWVFGYTDEPHGQAKVPGPTLIVNQGDTVNLTLNNEEDPTYTNYNAGGDGHTIHLHGLDLASEYDGDPMTLPDGHGVMQGSSYTYHFVAQDAGTYWYHCHVQAPEHIQMGMYGALIIRPRGSFYRAYVNTAPFDKEYTFVLSEIDSNAHQADYDHLNKNTPAVNWTKYTPNYFLINGKAWPDTLKDPRSNINATVGQTVLVRLINAGSMAHSMHSHGYHFTVIGTDGRALPQPYQKDTLDIGPGETYEILFHFDHAGRWMFHDHTEQDTTNNGTYPGGMLTMITVNNPNGTNPVPKLNMGT